MTLFLAPAIVALAVAGLADDKPFRVTTKRDGRMEVKVEEGKAIISIHSPFGISHAIIERPGGGWHETVLRLHLSGLEYFLVTGGKASLTATGRRLRYTEDGKERPELDAEIRAIGRDGKPSTDLPLKDGYFEVTLPPAFLAANPESIKIEWVDWYRR